MNVIYAREKLPTRNIIGLVPNSIFLVGPTPRSSMVKSWRPEALKLLKEKEFDGTVFVPEDKLGGLWEVNWTEQIWWEIEALSRATSVLAWVPRKLPDMPAFTTNTELGFLMALKSDRIVFGAPDDAEKIAYQKELLSNVDRFLKAFGLPAPLCKPQISVDLAECVEMAILMAGGH